jgi:hypothetical protein
MIVPIVCSLIPAPAGAGTETTEKVWLLSQSMQGVGDCNAYIGKNKLRIDDLTRHYSIIALDSSGQMTAFAPAQKLIYEGKLSQYKGLVSNRLGVFFGTQKDEQNWQRSGQERIAGLQTIKYVPVRDARHRAYWVTQEIKTAKPLLRFLSTYYDLPSFEAIPIQCFEGRHKTRVKLSTASAKLTNVPSKIFTTPKGFKKVKDLEILMFDQDAIKDW